MPEAPNVELNDWVQVNMVGRLHAQTCITTHLYQFWGESQGGMELNLEQVADEFLSSFWVAVGNRYRNAMSNAYTLQAITAQVISPIRSIAWPAVPEAADAPGAIVGPALPSGVAAVIRRRGNVGDRHNYGRVYMPGLPIAHTTDSALNATGVGAWTPVADAQASDLSIPGTGGNAIFRPFIMNKANIPQSRVVTHGLLDKTLRYQRRRELGVGI